MWFVVSFRFHGFLFCATSVSLSIALIHESNRIATFASPLNFSNTSIQVPSLSMFLWWARALVYLTWIATSCPKTRSTFVLDTRWCRSFPQRLVFIEKIVGGTNIYACRQAWIRPWTHLTTSFVYCLHTAPNYSSRPSLDDIAHNKAL